MGISLFLGIYEFLLVFKKYLNISSSTEWMCIFCYVYLDKYESNSFWKWSVLLRINCLTSPFKIVHFFLSFKQTHFSIGHLCHIAVKHSSMHASFKKLLLLVLYYSIQGGGVNCAFAFICFSTSSIIRHFNIVLNKLQHL